MSWNPSAFIASNACLRILHAESHMRQSAASAVLVDQLLHRRIRRERLQQLNQVRSIANLQQRLAHLILSVHLFAMNLPESQSLVGLHLALKLALLHRDRHVIHELDPGTFFSSSRTPFASQFLWPISGPALLELHQQLVHFHGLARLCTLHALHRSGARRSHIGLHLHRFQNQHQRVRLPTAWPGSTLTLITMPATGQRQTFLPSDTGSPCLPRACPAAGASVRGPLSAPADAPRSRAFCWLSSSSRNLYVDLVGFAIDRDL